VIPFRAKIVAMAHQAQSIKFSKTAPVLLDASDPGTGKTYVRIMVFAERRKRGGGCMLVLAPKSLLVSAWANDFKKFAPGMKVSVATAANRAKAFAADADVYITNVDGVKWLATQKRPFWKKFEDGELCIDESPAYKHHTSQRSKAALKVSKLFKYRSLMSGTPTSNSITDIWHQVMLLDGGKRLGDSFYAFRNSVCEPRQVGRNQDIVTWHDRDGAEEAVFGLLAGITIRHKLDDCVDIPKQLIYPVSYAMTTKQRKAYDDIEVAKLLFTAGGKISAINAASVATKLQQVASGAVYDNDSVAHVIDDARAEIVLDLVEARKICLVFFFWQHQRDQLVAAAEARGLRFCVIDGSTPDSDRAEYVRAYQAGLYKVMFAHPVTTAHGVTLTAGTTTIWASPTSNLEWWKQGNARQRRIGQKAKTEVIVVIAEDTVEERIYHEMLMPKDARMMNLLDLFADMTTERLAA
jgi:SNF2 family DNA or RNA helicase